MQLTELKNKKTVMKLNRRFSRTVGRLLAFFIVLVSIIIIKIIYFKIVRTDLIPDISEYDSGAPKSPLKLELRPDLIDIVNSSDPKYALPMNGPYRLENTTFCSSTINITILVIVLSSGNHFINRQVIRQTWANESLFSDYGTLRTIFLLGRTNNATVETKIEEEFRLFGDIVQGNFVDSLRNLTHKSIMGYNWVRNRCKNVKYVLKTDDDIVLNMFELLQNRIFEIYLNNHHVLCRRVIECYIDRNEESKVFVEQHQFKGKLFYPPFCSGQFVAMESDVVPFLYEAAIKTPYFWVDDVHMYGLAMNNIPALKYRQIQKNYGTYTHIELLDCLKQKKCHTLFFVTTDSTQVLKLWSDLFHLYH